MKQYWNGLRNSQILLFLFLMLLSACGTDFRDTGPVLVQEATLELPTLVPQVGGIESSPTSVAINPTPTIRTPEVVSPLNQTPGEADFILVTPTLPPSKTPTLTPTATPTVTSTRTATSTVTATLTSTVTQALFPTSVIIPVTQQVAQPVPVVCDSTWFFIQPSPPGCPLNPPLTSQAVYQEFQNGYMIWVQSQQAVYVMYNDNVQPRWQVFRDNFQEGMEEVTGEFLDSPFPNTWQPRRGFGLLWRSNEVVRSRIGWGTQEWETPYSVRVQTATDNAVYLSVPNDIVFALFANGSSWQRFTVTFGVPNQ